MIEKIQFTAALLATLFLLPVKLIHPDKMSFWLALCIMIVFVGSVVVFVVTTFYRIWA